MDINTYTAGTGFGDGTNVTKFESDGTIWDENCVAFSASGAIADDGDRIIMNVQIPHATKTDSTAYLHCHYEQTEAATTPREFDGRYRLQSNGSTKTTSWTTFTISTADGNVLPYTSGTLNQICELADVDLTGAGISSTLQVQLTRSDAEAGVVNLTFLDIHTESDQLGSKLQYSK